MLFTTAIFFLSLLTLVGLVGWQVRALRSGAVSVGTFDPETENVLSHENMIGYKNEMQSFIETHTRQLVLYALKISIKIGYFVKHELDAIVSAVHRTAARHERIIKQQEGEGETTGEFLKKIGEYKDRIGNKFGKK